ncbi:hypothetical protein C3B55_00827 [Candidatus Pseudomonas adelgestsugas]|uniref:Uncharacterized protein n=1 Tax=Candidatus Pseudomonas adelgestsugas TaxID=1302376 RepID=A0ABX5RA69_9PSED|nr:hypothetical protein C3B55_00827 [Candidatus Pseudomonas adelgestsugas]
MGGYHSLNQDAPSLIDRPDLNKLPGAVFNHAALFFHILLLSLFVVAV